MKLLKILFLSIICSNTMEAQLTITCPPDLTINAEDLDDSFSSYGDPIITSVGNFNLTREVSYVYNGCDNDFGTIITLSYTAVELDANQSVSCKQKISLVSATLDDVTFPADITLESIKVSDAKPSLAGQPNIYPNSSNLFVTWNDEVSLQAGNDAKIVRTWTVFDWCTGSILSNDQIILITNVLSSEENPAFVSLCNGSTTPIDDIIITTNDPGITINHSDCTIEDNNIREFINCVVSNNPIQDGMKYSIEFVKNNDYLNGVSTLDMINIQRHILLVEVLSDPCHLIAADVSNEGRITAIDLVELRKLILGIYTGLPYSKSWRFMNDSNGELKELEFSKNQFPLQSLNIVAIKVGDLNYTAQ